MSCQQSASCNYDSLLGKSQCHILFFQQELDFQGIKWCSNKVFNTQTTRISDEIIDISIEEDMLKQHEEVIRESFSNYMSWCRKRFQFMNAIGQNQTKQLTQIELENIISSSHFLGGDEKIRIIEYAKQNRLFYQLMELGILLSKNLLDQIVYLMYKISQTCTRLSQELDIEDETDIQKAIQSNIDCLTYEILQHPNFSSFIFNNREYVQLQFTKMIEKWFYTGLAIKQNYFANKYFIKKRKQNPSQNSQLNSQFLKDLEEEDFFPQRRKKIKSKY